VGILSEMAEGPQRARKQPRPRPSRQRGAVDRVRDARFPIVLRGYDRPAVDAYVAEVAQLVAELEATQLRENVVQRALDEVGEQTSGILQRAHETAEEVAARARAQAEGLMQRAERESAEGRREADNYAQEVEADLGRLREDRRRLIEDMRRLADEVLAVADDALERLAEPEQPPTAEASDGGSPEAGAPEDATAEVPPEDATAEVPVEGSPPEGG
jgi:cell division initiation protein